jgi:hypothetical protein
MIVSPRSAAAITCEKFWFASLTVISRIAAPCSTLQHKATARAAQGIRQTSAVTRREDVVSAAAPRY